jgi:hypothetical protein
MTADPGDAPFVPLPMHGSPSRPPSPPVHLVYLVYRAPEALEFPGVQGTLAGPVFHVAGVLLREDEEHLALGEVALAEENPEYADRFGKGLFPAFRHVLTLPKAAILRRRDFSVGPGPEGAALVQGDGPGEVGGKLDE